METIHVDPERAQAGVRRRFPRPASPRRVDLVGKVARSFGTVLCILAAALAVPGVAPARAENMVRWTSTVGMPAWEPAANNTPTSNGMAQVYEGLTLTGADLALRPALATAWTLVRPDTWRFELRRDMRFHDGAPLTAADVAFSLDRARGEGSDFAIYLTDITAVTAADEHTVEVATKRPDPLLPMKLRRVPILSKTWAEQHGVMRPARPGDTSTYVFAHANGTGPFKLESFEPGGRTVLVRNPDWWGRAEYPHNIDRIVWAAEPDAAKRLGLLLGGETDFLQDPPLDRLDRLRDAPGVKLVRMGVLGTDFLGLDQASAALRTSDVKSRNPFADRRVRQAVYQAIDVEALIAKARGGLGVPAGMLAPPGANGYSPELDRRPPYDLARAKALLDEAGYANGFDIRLDCVTSRRETCEELAAQLAKVGLRVTADAVPFDVYRQRVAGRATDFYVTYDGAGMTLDSVEMLRDIYFSRPHWVGATGYADPGVDAVIEKIDGETSKPARDALIEQVWRTVLDQVVVVPLYHPVTVWAMRDTLELPGHALPWPTFFQAHLIGQR